jgi:hypothetical protein
LSNASRGSYATAIVRDASEGPVIHVDAARKYRQSRKCAHVVILDCPMEVTAGQIENGILSKRERNPIQTRMESHPKVSSIGARSHDSGPLSSFCRIDIHFGVTEVFSRMARRRHFAHHQVLIQLIPRCRMEVVLRNVPGVGCRGSLHTWHFAPTSLRKKIVVSRYFCGYGARCSSSTLTICRFSEILNRRRAMKASHLIFDSRNKKVEPHG